MVNVSYLALARVPDKCPLVQFTLDGSKDKPKSLYDSKLTRLLESESLEEQPRLTITDNELGHIHYSADPAFIFVVITSPEYPQSTAFKLLTEMRAAFEKDLGDEMSSSKSQGLTKQAKPILTILAAKYQDAERADRLASVVVQVQEVKSVMQQNIQSALKNQDNLETLLDNSDNMRNEASSFNQSTNRVRRDMQWKNAKMWFYIILLLICLTAVAVVPIVLKKGKAPS